MVAPCHVIACTTPTHLLSQDVAALFERFFFCGDNLRFDIQPIRQPLMMNPGASTADLTGMRKSSIFTIVCKVAADNARPARCTDDEFRAVSA